MCFSAQASFVAGIGLLGLGVVTVKSIRNRGERLYAWIPMLFGIQQLVEGALWLTFPDHVPILSRLLTFLFLLFSNVLWPIYVPLAVLALEPIKWRRRMIVATATLGATVGVYLLGILVLSPVTACVDGKHILYDFNNPYDQTTIVLYVIVTCMSLLFSSHRRVMLFGVATFVSEVIAYTFYTTWFISVWCFFAAVLSMIVWWHFMGRRATHY